MLSPGQIQSFRNDGYLVFQPDPSDNSWLTHWRTELERLLPDWQPLPMAASVSGFPLKYRPFHAGRNPDRRQSADDPGLYGKEVSLPWKNGQDTSLFDSIVRLLTSSHARCIGGSFGKVYPGWTGDDGKFHTEIWRVVRQPSQVGRSGHHMVQVVCGLSGLNSAGAQFRVIPGSHQRYQEINRLLAKKLVVSPKCHQLVPTETIYEELLDFLPKPVPVNVGKETILFLDGALLYTHLPHETERDVLPMATLYFSDGSNQMLEGINTRTPTTWQRYRKYFLKPARRVRAQAQRVSPFRLLKYLEKNTWYRLSRLLHAPLRRVNLGAGPGWRHPTFLGLDCDAKADVRHLIREGIPLPFASNSLEVMYTSHCIEHMMRSTALHFIQECYRSLDKRGILRITCPDMDTLFDAYERKDVQWFNWIRKKGFYIHDSWLRMITRNFADPAVDQFSDQELYDLYRKLGREGFMTHLELGVNRCSKDILSDPSGHKSWWTKAKLKQVLKECGFSEVTVCHRNESRCKELRDRHFFDKNHPQMSLYVEAVK